MGNDYNRESRFDKRTQRKKTNFILNGLIVFVLLLIVIVSVSIFSGGKDKPADVDTEASNTAETNKQDKPEQGEAVEEQASDEQVSTDNDNDSETAAEEEKKDEDVEAADQEQDVVTSGGSDANVIRTIENPSWQPVGTAQSGEHSAVYDSSSVDWQEMLKAITYATGIEQSNMTVWFLGNNGPNKSVARVSTKDKSQKYRVYIDWVDGAGWMPVKMEELNEIQ